MSSGTPKSRRASPRVGRGVGSIEGEFDVLGPRARSPGERLAGDRRDDIEVLAFHGRHELAAYEVVVGWLEGELGAGRVGVRVNHGWSPTG